MAIASLVDIIFKLGAKEKNSRENLLIERWLICSRTTHRANVDEVETVLFVAPLRITHILNFKLHIGYTPYLGYRRQIKPDNLRWRVLICEPYSPDSGTSPNVKHLPGILPNWHEVQFAIKRQVIQVMCNVKLVVLFLIIWDPTFPIQVSLTIVNQDVVRVNQYA
jgi:hypothetical protein